MIEEPKDYIFFLSGIRKLKFNKAPTNDDFSTPKFMEYKGKLAPIVSKNSFHGFDL